MASKARPISGDRQSAAAAIVLPTPPMPLVVVVSAAALRGGAVTLVVALPLRLLRTLSFSAELSSLRG